MKIITQFTDFFLPRLCPSCGVKLNFNETAVCYNCLSKIKETNDLILNVEYERKFSDEKFISDFASIFIYEKGKEIQHLIHSLKYQSKFKNGLFLGKLIFQKLSDRINSWHAEYLAPIPLHPVKKAERGYNQSYYIAKGISLQSNIKLINHNLKRLKFTKSQTKLSLIERKDNISGAFGIRFKKKIRGKRIIIVDDVITTGATLRECGKILLEHGAKEIFALTAAIADFNLTFDREHQPLI